MVPVGTISRRAYRGEAADVSVLAGEAYRWYQNLRDARVAAAYATLILILSVASTVLFLLLLPTEEDRSA